MADKKNQLTEEELRLYFEKYQSGNMDARDILICQNMGLIYSVIRYYFSSYFDKESLASAGKIGLIHAVDHFDLKKEVKFSTFATKCIFQEMLKTINEDMYPQSISLNQLQDDGYDKDKIAIIKDESIDVEKNLEKEELYVYLYQALQKLPERTRNLIMTYYNLDNQKKCTLGDLEKLYGISDTRILQILEQGQKQLKACLEFDYSTSSSEDSSLVDYFTQEDKKIMMLYLDGYSKTSIANLLSLPVKVVSNKITNIKKQLTYLGKKEEMKVLLQKRIAKQVVRK